MNRRPRLTIVAPDASAEEAAAVVAAVERFMRDLTPPRISRSPRRSAWRDAALAEGVDRRPRSVRSWLQ